MRGTFMEIVMGFYVIFVLFAFVMLILCVVNAYGEFEYTTASGEKGTATSCMISYGSARCVTEDGTELIVESFKKVK